MPSTTLGAFLLCTSLAILTSACATKALWEATDPAEYVSVPQTDVSEAELRERGIDYRRDDTQGLYYVEKSNIRRLGDYSIRFFATPITVALDAVPAIVVIGTLYGLDRADNQKDGQ